MVFRKGGRVSLQFKYGDHDIDVAYRFSYLGIVFATGEVFQEMENTTYFTSAA